MAGKLKSITSNGITFHIGDTVKSQKTGNIYKIRWISNSSFGLNSIKMMRSSFNDTGPILRDMGTIGARGNQFVVIKTARPVRKVAGWK